MIEDHPNGGQVAAADDPMPLNQIPIKRIWKKTHHGLGIRVYFLFPSLVLRAIFKWRHVVERYLIFDGLELLATPLVRDGSMDR